MRSRQLRRKGSQFQVKSSVGPRFHSIPDKITRVETDRYKGSFLLDPEAADSPTFRSNKRYSSSEFEVRIRERIAKSYRAVKPRPKTPFELVRQKTKTLPQLAPTPIIKQPKVINKEFVFNFYRKGKILKAHQQAKKLLNGMYLPVEMHREGKGGGAGGNRGQWVRGQVQAGPPGGKASHGLAKSAQLNHF